MYFSALLTVLFQKLYYCSQYNNSLAPIILIISAFSLAVLYFVSFVRNLFQLLTITQGHFWLCFVVAFARVIWLYKTYLLKIKRNESRHSYKRLICIEGNVLKNSWWIFQLIFIYCYC